MFNKIVEVEAYNKTNGLKLLGNSKHDTCAYIGMRFKDVFGSFKLLNLKIEALSKISKFWKLKVKNP